jgi:hypothetical protein
VSESPYSQAWPRKIVSAQGMVRLPDDPVERAALFETFIRERLVVLVLFDANAAGVRAPAHLRGRVIFEYALDAPVVIPDLLANAAGIQATLSFGTVPHETFLPWAAVLAIRVLEPGPVWSRRMRRAACKAAGLIVAGLAIGTATFWATSPVLGIGGLIVACTLSMLGLRMGWALARTRRQMRQRPRSTAVDSAPVARSSGASANVLE